MFFSGGPFALRVSISVAENWITCDVNMTCLVLSLISNYTESPVAGDTMCAITCQSSGGVVWWQILLMMRVMTSSPLSTQNPPQWQQQWQCRHISCVRIVIIFPQQQLTRGGYLQAAETLGNWLIWSILGSNVLPHTHYWCSSTIYTVLNRVLAGARDKWWEW